MNTLDLLYILGVGVTAPIWLRKKRSGWAQRLGHIEPLREPEHGRMRVMLHAVSVGEVSALRELVPLLVESADVVVSTTTDTGMARATSLFEGSCQIVRYPLDFSRSVRRALDAVRPDVVGLVELEVWPNFVKGCSARGIPVGVINGRLSERSFRGYRKIRALIRPTFGRLASAGVQDETYAERFVAMGVAPDRCRVTGSMKWDSARIGHETEGAREGTALGESMGIDPQRALIVAGSTGPGEEALLHEACPAGVQLLCAPRKPERFNEAAAALPGCVRRSQGRAAGGGGVGLGGGTGRFVLDTIGELRQAYALADVVVVGRSFGGLFGSDPIEPIALGKATAIGPAVSDFETIVGLLDRAGGIVRTTRDGLGGVLGDLIANPNRRRELGERGQACIRDQQGASARHAELLLELASQGAAGGL